MQRFRALGMVCAAGMLGGCVSEIGVQDHRSDLTDCPVHHVPLKDEVLPISYGYFRFRIDEFEARETLFPYSHETLRGGCVVGPRRRYRISYCESCREAYEVWRRTEPPPDANERFAEWSRRKQEARGGEAD